MNHTVLFDFHDLSSVIVGDFVTRKNMWLYAAYVFNLFPYTRTVYRFWYGVLGMDIYIDVSCDNVDNTLQLVIQTFDLKSKYLRFLLLRQWFPPYCILVKVDTN